MSSPRHSYSEQAGKNVANPAAMLLCAANFLDYACLNDHASRWESILNPKKQKRLDLDLKKQNNVQGTKQCIGSVERGPSENKGFGKLMK